MTTFDGVSEPASVGRRGSRSVLGFPELVRRPRLENKSGPAATLTAGPVAQWTKQRFMKPGQQLTDRWLLKSRAWTEQHWIAPAGVNAAAGLQKLLPRRRCSSVGSIKLRF